MNGRNDISDELRGLNSPLADISRAMPYSVPGGYFHGLVSDVTESIKFSEADDPIAGWGRKMPYAVPAGYFESLPREMTIIAAPQLPGDASQPFTVPQGYFEQLPQQILEAVKKAEQPANKQPARVIPLGNIWKNVRWAAAAILLVTIGMGSYRILQGNDTLSPQQQLAKISDKTIAEYVQQNIDEFDMESIENTVAANTDIKSLNTNNLPDEDIILYLKENGWDEEVLIN